MKETMKVGIGQTPQLCQDALIEMLPAVRRKEVQRPGGAKPLAIFKQDLPIPEENDVDADTDVAHAPYIVVRMTGGEIADDSPQPVEFSLIICAYDTGIERAGFQDVANIKEDIVQRACTAPYFGGAFTILKPIARALQQDDAAVLLRSCDHELYSSGHDPRHRIGGTAMSKKTEPRAADMAAPMSEAAAAAEVKTAVPMEREAKTGPVVYCGPSVRGVARQYTVYAGTIPAALADFIQAHPAAKGLLVSVGRFAQVRSNLGRSGTAEAILFQKIKSEL